MIRNPRFRGAALVLLVALLVAGCAHAAGPAPPPAASPPIRVMVDGHALTLDVDPIVEEGRVLVPFRPVFEALGAEVTWRPVVREARATRGDLEIEVLPGCRGAFVGNSVRWMDPAPRVVQGWTLVPLEFARQALGAAVSWDSAARLVTVTSGTPPPLDPSAVGVEIHFIDVGQGDAILIQVTGGSTVLIDAGPIGAGPTVVAYLQDEGVKKLDYVIATHPHADHIGGLPDVIPSVAVSNVVDPGVAATSKIYVQYWRAVQASGTRYDEGRTGMTLNLGGGAGMRVLYPGGDPPTSPVNACSVATLLTLGNVDVLLPADLPDTCEMQAAQAVEVLKVAHHGSSTSTSDGFLGAVQPRDAVISVGPNGYGHPAPDTLERLHSRGAHIYRTDVQGTLIMVTDGTEYSFNQDPWRPR